MYISTSITYVSTSITMYPEGGIFCQGRGTIGQKGEYSVRGGAQLVKMGDILLEEGHD
jgi:hypothetical protein